MNKSGALTDLFLVLILAFALSIICGLLYYAISEVTDKMHDIASELQDSVSTTQNMSIMIQESFGAVKNAYENLKWISVMLIVGLFLFTAVLLFPIMLMVVVLFFLKMIADVYAKRLSMRNLPIRKS